jgi:glyoxylate carboligase
MHNESNHRIETLERTVRRQGYGLVAVGGLLGLSIFAGATMRASSPTHVIIDKPVKIVLEDIGFNVRSSHPLPVLVKTK